MLKTSGLLPSVVTDGWPCFMWRHWEKTPARFELPIDFALPSGEQLMRLVQKATQQVPASRVRVFLGRRGHLSEAQQFYPTSSDSNLEMYLNRAAELAHDDFTLVINGAQEFDFEFCCCLHSFSRGLLKEIGLPLKRDVVVYASHAAKTAAGVHKDPCSNFLFPVIGRKRFRLWPAEALRSNTKVIGSVSYEEVINESIACEVERGNLLYMPSSYYHVAEAEHGLSVHVSLVLRTDGIYLARSGSWRSRRLW
jgi:hypothetical protein